MQNTLKNVDVADLLKGVVSALTDAVDRGTLDTRDAIQLKKEIERRAQDHAVGKAAPQSPLASISCVSNKEVEMNTAHAFISALQRSGLPDVVSDAIIEQADIEAQRIRTGVEVIPDSIRGIYGLPPLTGQTGEQA